MRFSINIFDLILVIDVWVISCEFPIRQSDFRRWWDVFTTFLILEDCNLISFAACYVGLCASIMGSILYFICLLIGFETPELYASGRFPGRLACRLSTVWICFTLRQRAVRCSCWLNTKFLSCSGLSLGCYLLYPFDVRGIQWRRSVLVQ